MKPQGFDYCAPRSLEEALAVLAEYGGEAKVLAGGQRLMPMLNFRLIHPKILVDLNRVPGLFGISQSPAGIAIKALTRHHSLEMSFLVASRLPVLRAGMRHVAHLAVRNRGTMAGSLCHADPAAELPALAIALDASLEVVSPRGIRVVRAADFFLGPLSTILHDDEVVTEITLPELPGCTGWAFREFARRAGDFAIAGVVVLLQKSGSGARDIRVVLFGLGETAQRCAAAETLLEGQALGVAQIAQAAEAVRDTVEPTSDLHGSSDYRRHLAGGLVELALAEAWQRAQEISDE